MARATVGELMREWRTRRRRSQMDLSHDVGVSTRHLSFVETGRSRPSPELVLAVAEHLDVPLRERNRMLLAAGYAPRFGERRLDDPALGRALDSLRRMLDAHDPYPGVVIDRRWDVLLANGAAARLVEGLPAHVVGDRLNVFRACLHPDGLAPATLDFRDWAGYLLRQIRRTVELTGEEAADGVGRDHASPGRGPSAPARRGQGVSRPAVAMRLGRLLCFGDQGVIR